MQIHLRSLILLVLNLLLGSCSAPGQPIPPDVPQKGSFLPPDGKTLFVIGQDLGAISDYVKATGHVPGGVTTYTDISEGDHDNLLHGLTSTVTWGSGDINAQALVDGYPQSILVVGLNVVDQTGTNLQHMADGTHNAAIDRLGAFIRASGRPVFLRIGYEFDGAWNHYAPAPFIAAFRAIVDRLNEQEVTNFATVWQSATSPGGRFENRPFEDWYPGDDYVDWFGTSYFVFDRGVHDAFLASARAHEKPVMIAESTPQGYDIEELTFSDPGDGSSFQPMAPADIWAEWYAPFFSYIHENADVIRAVAYINVDWHSQPMWGPGAGNGYWGDSRVQANPLIQSLWMNELQDERWYFGGPGLFAELGTGTGAK